MSHLEIVEQIGSYLTSKNAPWSEELTEVAAEYAMICREANDRLRRCMDYLRRGMRSEAVHLAGCLPSLLELVPALHLAEFEQWSAACLAAAVPPPPRLQVERVKELESAQERERELQPWLTRHRILALACADARERLGLARALAEKDPGNPCWMENVRELEATRLREMHLEAKHAFRERDLKALEAIPVELNAQAWLTPIPDDLRLGLQAAMKKLRVDVAVEALDGLLPGILAAYASRDYERCSNQMQRWQDLVNSTQIAVPAELQSQVRPVAGWLTTQGRSRGVEQRMNALKPILRAEEEVLRRRATQKKTLSIGLAVGVAAAIAVACCLYFRVLHF